MPLEIKNAKEEVCNVSIFKASLEPGEVFNPRGEYNSEMYVKRPKYEEEFESALESDMCILIHGQSGTGKTWLTRRMLENKKVYYKVINLANASNSNSIYSCFKSLMSREHWEIRTARSEKMAAELKVPVAGAQLETTSTYENSIDYFMEFLKFMSYRANDKRQKRYIVFENMETILNSEQMIKEMANFITLIDDDEVAKFRTKFIIIGATKDIHEYFRKVLNVNTIDNRIFELTDVSTLTVPQTRELIVRGFNKLEISFENEQVKNKCIDEYIRITAGIPQRVHELCLIFSQIARKCVDDVGMKEIEEGKRKWIRTSLNKNYAYISRLLNIENNSDSLKSKVLYCIAQLDVLYFTSEKIECEVIQEFPEYSKEKKIRTTKVLNELCQCEPPLLSKTEDLFGEYSFVDFKCALCLRAILCKDGEKVLKNDIYDI